MDLPKHAMAESLVGGFVRIGAVVQFSVPCLLAPWCISFNMLR